MVGDPSLCEAVTRLQAVTSTCMARPGRPERSRTARSSRQLRRFQRGVTLGWGFPNADRENTRRTVIREKLPITYALSGAVHSTGRTEPDRCTKALEDFLPPAFPGRFSRGSRFR